ncbi:J domain-containing protein [Ramlibacter terrae]|uniref:J domain-containing protein n=1 Tax=Ramlibacter terrae TaxID=2732511 RepID=A0ABX6P2F8_9BURK|nr:J domain-containing protein [Ramlibacter terrae]
MKDAAEPTTAISPALHAALLDYFAFPGRHQLALRQPVLLFGSIREVLQIAAGRGLSPDAAGKPGLREAAAFFLRAALLYPGADHYAVLGFAPRTEPVDVKERYRLLMRLIHPDFAGSGSAPRPADAAVRVNLAYEVLSSPVLRAEYDGQLAALASERPAAARGMDPRRPGPESATDADEDPVTKRKLAWALVAAGVAVVTGILLMPRVEQEALVQKPASDPNAVAPTRHAEPPPPEPAAALLAAGNLSPASVATAQPATVAAAPVAETVAAPLRVAQVQPAPVPPPPPRAEAPRAVPLPLPSRSLPLRRPPSATSPPRRRRRLRWRLRWRRRSPRAPWPPIRRLPPRSP